jgi:hypothetical protein
MKRSVAKETPSRGGWEVFCVRGEVPPWLFKMFDDRVMFVTVLVYEFPG